MSLKVEYINPFLTATINLFSTSFNINPKVEAPFLLDPKQNHRWEISSLVVIEGSQKGIFAIRMTKFLMEKLLEKSGIIYVDEEERKMLQTEMVKEMINIIGGNAATELSQYEINLSVPFIVQGENHAIPWPKGTQAIGIPFISNYGPFLTCVTLI
ncbi:MAG: chemotaxis protein CheX [Spirochaetales bacterium]|nr:chemotaxis protein CheX [Spirochaetales bacterium]